MSKTLYQASITTVRGYEGETFFSDPKRSRYRAFQNLQDHVHNIGGTADWTKVTMETFTNTETSEINPFEEFKSHLEEDCKKI